MPKRYRVSPYAREGREGIFVTFRRADGSKKFHLRLEVNTHARAQIIADSLAALWIGGIRKLEDCPPEVPPLARRLYFGLAADDAPPLASLPLELPAWPEEDIVRVPADLRQRLRDMLFTCAVYAEEAGRLQLERDEARRNLSALESTTIARAAEAARRCPPLADALKLFERDLAGVTPKHARECVAAATSFNASLPPSVRNLAQVTPDQIAAWLQAACTGAKMPNVRMVAKRRLLGRYLSWSAKRYGYPCQLQAVVGPKRAQVKRERGAIQVHSMEEVHAAVKSAPDAYWKALVGVLAYAGLRLNELRYLRPSDYLKLPNRRRGLQVAAVDFGDGDAHLLKTARSSRTVPVSKRLQRLIDAHLAAGGAGERCLFPARVSRRRRTGRGLRLERWSGDRLRRALRKFMPARMDAPSLRRSIATAWRLKMSEGDVAILLGNTSAVTTEHYAARYTKDISTDVE